MIFKLPKNTLIIAMLLVILAMGERNKQYTFHGSVTLAECRSTCEVGDRGIAIPQDERETREVLNALPRAATAWVGIFKDFPFGNWRTGSGAYTGNFRWGSGQRIDFGHFTATRARMVFNNQDFDFGRWESLSNGVPTSTRNFCVCEEEIEEINGSDVQAVMDAWCSNLGTDDDVEVGGDHPDCNDNNYARYAAGAWRCVGGLLSTVEDACMSNDGVTREPCRAADLSKGRCTRNSQLLEVAKNAAASDNGPVVPTPTTTAPDFLTCTLGAYIGEASDDGEDSFLACAERCGLTVGCETFDYSSSEGGTCRLYHTPDETEALPIDASRSNSVACRFKDEEADEEVQPWNFPGMHVVSTLHSLERDTECWFGHEALSRAECEQLAHEWDAVMLDEAGGAEGQCYVTAPDDTIPSAISFIYATSPPTADGFFCKTLPLQDDLDTADIGTSECSDGDLTTICVGETMDVEMTQPMMLMRVFVRNAVGTPSDGVSVAVEAFDGSEWNVCARRSYLFEGSDWKDINCESTQYAERIRIRAEDGEILMLSEIRPQGVHYEEGMELENGREWRAYENSEACTEVQNTVIHFIRCNSEDCSNPEQICRDLGPQCWAYATRPGNTIEFYNAGAANIWECEEEMGFSRRRRVTTYRRSFKQIYDVTLIHGNCWTYKLSENDLQVNAECSDGDLEIAKAVAYSLEGVHLCAEMHGFDAVGSRECAPIQQFRRPRGISEAGREEVKIWDDSQGLTESCLNERRREEPEWLTEFRSHRAAPRRRQAPPGQCENDAQARQSARCSLLQSAIDINVEIQAAEEELFRLQDDELTRSTRFNRAIGATDTVGGVFDAVSTGLVFGIPTGSGPVMVPSMTPMVGRRRRYELSTERRREPFTIGAISVLTIGAIINFSGGVLSTVNGDQAAEAQREINAVQARISNLQSRQANLREAERLAATCTGTTTDDLACQLDRLGIAQDMQTEIIASSFGVLFNFLDEQHFAVLESFERQNAILRSQSMSLDRIERALARIERRIQEQFTALTFFQANLEDIQLLRPWKGRGLESAATSRTEWCNMMDESADLRVVSSVVVWATSETFRDITAPDRERVPGEENLWSRCEKTEFLTDYTVSFEEHKQLFEFAAQRWLRANSFATAIDEDVVDWRMDMTMAYNRNFEYINNLPEGVRCVTDPVECPAGHHDVSATFPTIADQPCEVNVCACPAGTESNRLRSTQCVEHGVTLGCTGDAPSGWHLEEPADGLPVFVRNQAICQHGLPSTNFQDLTEDGIEICDPQGCFTDRARYVSSSRVCELHQCMCQSGGRATTGAQCRGPGRNSMRRNQPLTRDHCATCQGAPRGTLERVRFRTSWFRTLVDGCVFSNLRETFRVNNCRNQVWTSNVRIPRSTTLQSYLEIRWISDEDSRASREDLFQISINGGRGSTFAQQTRCRGDGCTGRIPLSTFKTDNLHIEIIGSSRNNEGHLHPRLRIEYVPGPGPVFFNIGEGEVRTCGVPEGVVTGTPADRL